MGNSAGIRFGGIGFGKSAVMEAQLLYTSKPKLFDSTHRGIVCDSGDHRQVLAQGNARCVLHAQFQQISNHFRDNAFLCRDHIR